MSDPEELSPIEEIGDDPLLSHPKVSSLIGNIDRSVIPFLFIDLDLRVLYGNDSFCRLYAFNEVPLYSSFLAIFSVPSREDVTADEIDISLKQEKSGFSWQGQLEYQQTDRLNTVAQVSIIPALNNKLPIGYFASFCDLTKERRTFLRSYFSGLLEASKLKDNDTGNHIKRVNEYSHLIAEILQGDPEYPQVDYEFIDSIAYIAAMHDVGKIGTPDDILNKDGKLSESEWVIMKEHTINGAFILSSYPNEMAGKIASFHHEKWSGSGYPYGLSEQMIPLEARITALADVYDALRTQRSYKPPFSHEKAKTIIMDESDGHFDPKIKDVFGAEHSRFARIFDDLGD